MGKASLFQVTHALGVKAEENLAMIADSFAFLHKKNPKRELFFDAEHFFDGAKDNETIRHAMFAGGGGWRRIGVGAL